MKLTQPLRTASRTAPLLTLLAFAACHQPTPGSPVVTTSPLLLGGEDMVSTDTPGASDKYESDLAFDGPNVYAVWTDDRSGVERIYLNASYDGGATWQVTDLPLPIQVGSFGASRPSIVCEGLTVHVAYEDDSDSYDDIFYTRSTDGGASWAAPVRLNTGPINSQDTDRAQLALTGGNLYCVWEDARNDPSGGDDQIFFNMSNDGGLTWLPTDVRLNTGAPAGSDADTPVIAADGTNVYVAWQEERGSGPELRANVSSDGGATWLPTAVRLDGTITAGLAGVGYHKLACDGTSVYAAWRDSRDDAGDLYFNASHDGGTTWLPSAVRVDNAPFGSRTEEVGLGCDGGTVCIAWEDDRNGVDDIYFNRSGDGGATWLPADVRLDTDPGANDSDDPVLVMDGSHVFVAWDDDRGGVTMRMNASIDGGLTFLPNDVRVDEAPVGFAYADSATLVAEGDTFHVLWLDERTGLFPDVYVNGGTIPGVEE